MAHSERLNRIVAFFETISESSLPQLRELYAVNAYFKDPFNEVNDIAAIEHIFAHMFVSTDAPRFVVTSRIEQGDEAFLVWEFRFQIKRYQPHIERVIRGASHLKFDNQSRVSFHRDYWDAAEELYEKLPVIGSIMRWMKRQMA